MGAIVVAAGGSAAMQTLVAAGGCSVAMEAFAVGRRLRSSSGGSCFLALRGKLGLVVLAQQQWRPLLWRVVAQFSFQINVQRVAPLSPLEKNGVFCKTLALKTEAMFFKTPEFSKQVGVCFKNGVFSERSVLRNGGR